MAHYICIPFIPSLISPFHHSIPSFTFVRSLEPLGVIQRRAFELGLQRIQQMECFVSAVLEAYDRRSEMEDDTSTASASGSSEPEFAINADSIWRFWDAASETLSLSRLCTLDDLHAFQTAVSHLIDQTICVVPVVIEFRDSFDWENDDALQAFLEQPS